VHRQAGKRLLTEATRITTSNRGVRRTDARCLLSVLALALVVAAPAYGQDGARETRRSPRTVAPFDLTGYWVSIVTQDWRQRMVTPPKGDYESVPITAEAKKVGDAWDPAKDEAAGEQCRSYGAPALMRVPGRVHITWQDEVTLKIDVDTGEQTRRFHFDTAALSGAPSWQGHTIARWESAAGGKSATLKAVTTHLRPGYLRKNGVPYSANAVLTEYWDVFTIPDGQTWLTITTIVEDPLYLRMPWLTALHFKKEADGSKWDPSPCSAFW
jgi:hypothetical protein